MIVPSQNVKIVVATKPVDFRKGHDGLAAVVQNELGLDPHSGVIVPEARLRHDVVFRAKRGDRIKVLLWDGTGLVMIYKRMEDTKFAWPSVHDGVMRFFICTAPPTRTKAQFEALFGRVENAQNKCPGLAAGLWAACSQTDCRRMTLINAKSDVLHSQITL